jgi:hypothetical protein
VTLALLSRQRGQATPGRSFRRQLSLAPGRATADGALLDLPDGLLRSLARYPGHEDDAAVAVRQEDQRTVAVRTRRHVVRERDRGAVEAEFGCHLVRYAERSEFARSTDRSLVREPDHARAAERPAIQAAVEGGRSGQFGGFLRRAEHRASQTAADGSLVRRYEPWAFQGIGA